ncbi:MAG: diguanylate cyclase [Bacillota bacterium]
MSEINNYYSENRFSNYFEYLPIGIAIINGRGDFLEVNKSILETTSFKRKEILRGNVLDFTVDLAENEIKIAIEKTIIFNENEIECKVRCKNGSIIDVEVELVLVADDEILMQVKDITKKKQISRAVHKQWAYFKELFDGSIEAISLLDDSGRLIMVNKSFEKVFGYQAQDIEGRFLDDIIVPETRKAKALKLTAQVIEKKEKVIVEGKRKRSNGELIDVVIKSFPIIQEDELLGLYAIYQDITERKQEEEKIKYLSYHDQMTGLYNRRYFENKLKEFDKSGVMPVSILVADLDKLKPINDKYGHPEGDKYIIAAADVLKSITRDDDIVARIGGDEFAIILPELTCHQAERITERINNECKKDQSYGFNIEISIGCATKCDEKDSLVEVFKMADTSMYKNKGKFERNNLKRRQPGEVL